MTTVRRQPALSMTEMVAVMAIIAILAAIATPRVADALARRRADAAARRIVADLDLAQRHARITSTEQAVKFKPTPNTYTVGDLDDPEHPGEDYVVSLADEPYRADIVSATFSSNEVRFDGYGVPNEGGSIIIQVGNHQKTVAVDADTGRASVP